MVPGREVNHGENTLWERSTYVPLVFVGPGVVAGRCVQPVELLDVYPILIELCALSVQGGLEGHSLVPQLGDAAARRKWPAVTTANHDNHAVRTNDWRYIRYADGSEELYDMRSDVNEWQNRAGDENFADIIVKHRRWLPRVNTPPAPGSRSRVLVYRNGKATWEGQEVTEGSAVPGL